MFAAGLIIGSRLVVEYSNGRSYKAKEEDTYIISNETS